MVLSGVAAVTYAPLVVAVLTVALIMVPSRALSGHWSAGFRVFTTSPWRAVLLTLLSIVVIGALWVGALLSGFFITGWQSSALTWLGFGVAAVLLVCAWTALQARPSRT